MKPFDREARQLRRLARLTHVADAFATSPLLPGNDRLDPERKRLPTEAIRLVGAYLAQFNWPMPPQLTFRGIRTATRDEQTPIEEADAEILLSAHFMTASGVRHEFEIPVAVRQNKLLEPSVAIVNGSPRIIAQSLVDEVTKAGTFRQKIDPRGNIYGPPMDQMARDIYLETEDRLKERDRFSKGMYSVGSRTAQSRQELEDAVWQTTHPDYRGEGPLADGSGEDPGRRILVMGPRGTTLAPLSTLSDDELRQKLRSDHPLRGGQKTAQPASYTVREVNEMLGQDNYVGTFQTEQEAREYAEQKAGRSRSFARFEVWTGTPRQPGQQVGEPLSGTASRKAAQCERCKGGGDCPSCSGMPITSPNRETCQECGGTAKCPQCEGRGTSTSSMPPGYIGPGKVSRHAQGLSCQFCSEPIMGQPKKVKVGPASDDFVWADEQCAQRAKQDPNYKPNVPGSLYARKHAQAEQCFGVVTPEGDHACPTGSPAAYKVYSEGWGKLSVPYCESCLAAYKQKWPDSGIVREEPIGASVTAQATTCADCGHAREMHIGEGGACMTIEWKSSPCGCQRFVDAGDAQTRPARRAQSGTCDGGDGQPATWLLSSTSGMDWRLCDGCAQDVRREYGDENLRPISGGGRSAQSQFPPGARVLVDGRDEAIVRECFPEGSSSYAFPHYKVNMVGGDQNIAVPIERVGIDRKARRAQSDAPYYVCPQCGGENIDSGATAATMVCRGGSSKDPSCRYEGPREEFIGPYYRPRTAQKYDPGARVKVDGQPARVVEQVHEPSESGAWDGTYRIEKRNGETDVVPESKLSYDEERATLRHVESRQAHSITCSGCGTAFVSSDSCPGCGSTGEGDLSGYEDARPTMHGRKSGQVLGKDQLPVCDKCDQHATSHVGGEWLCDEHRNQPSPQPIPQDASLPGIGLGARVQQGGRVGQVVEVRFDRAVGGQLVLVAWHEGGEDYFTAKDFQEGQVAREPGKTAAHDMEAQSDMASLDDWDLVVGLSPMGPNREQVEPAVKNAIDALYPPNWRDLDDTGVANLAEQIRSVLSGRQAQSHRPPKDVVQSRQAAHDEDGQPAEHNEDRKQDDFSAGDTVSFSTSFRNRTRGGPSYLIDSGTSAEVMRDVFEDGTRFEVRLPDGQLAIVPRETLKSAGRQAQAQPGRCYECGASIPKSDDPAPGYSLCRACAGPDDGRGDLDTSDYPPGDVGFESARSARAAQQGGYEQGTWNPPIVDGVPLTEGTKVKGPRGQTGTVIGRSGTSRPRVTVAWDDGSSQTTEEPANLKIAQVGEGEVLRVKRESEVPCDFCGSTSFLPSPGGLVCASCGAQPFDTGEQKAPAAPAPAAPAPAQPAAPQPQAFVAQQRPSPTVDQVIREVEALKGKGYDDVDVLLAVNQKYPQLADAVMTDAKDKGLLDV